MALHDIGDRRASDRMALVECEKEYRRRALAVAYDRWKEKAGSGSVPYLKASELSELLNIEDKAAVRVLEHLREKDLLKSLTQHDTYAISVKGRETVENPDKFDAALPPPVVQNLIQVEGDLNLSGTLQQGTTNVATQGIAWDEVESLVAQIRRQMGDALSEGRERDDVLTDLDALTSQARKTKPDVGVARGLFEAAWKGLQGMAALQSLYPLLQALAASLGFQLPALP